MTYDPYKDNYYFYHYDKRGSTTTILQPDGTLIKGYTYDEFGNLAQSGAGSFLNEVTSTGSITDTSSGLQYMNARYYDSKAGRFISQDSYTGNAYEPWTQHLYSYCANYPVNFIDPTGHFYYSVVNGKQTQYASSDKTGQGKSINGQWWAMYTKGSNGSYIRITLPDTSDPQSPYYDNSKRVRHRVRLQSQYYQIQVQQGQMG